MIWLFSKTQGESIYASRGEDLCSARNMDVEYEYSQGEDHKHLMEDIDVFVL